MPGKDELSESVTPCGERSLSPASSTIHTSQCTPGSGPLSRGPGFSLTYKEKNQMLGIAQVSDDQQITVKPAVKFSAERGVYLAPVTWTGQTMMFCIMRECLQQEFTQALCDGRDLAVVFDPETYRGLAGGGVYLDYYYYVPPEPGEKNQRNYAK